LKRTLICLGLLLLGLGACQAKPRGIAGVASPTATTRPGVPTPSTTPSPDLGLAQTATDWAQFQATLGARGTEAAQGFATYAAIPLNQPTGTPTPAPPGPGEDYPGLPATPNSPLVVGPADAKSPPLPASAYRLKPPTEQELFQQAYLTIKDEFSDFDYFYSPDPIYFRQALKQEFLLRYPNSSLLDLIRWSYVDQAPGDPLASPGLTATDPFAALVEDALNKGQTSPDTLSTWLSERGFDFSFDQPVSHLFENEDKAWIFQLNISAHQNFIATDNEAVYALRQDSSGKYQVISIYPWAFDFHAWMKVLSTDDFTGDQKAEIAIESGFDAHGSTAGECWSNLLILTWDSQSGRFVNLANPVPGFQGYQDNCASPWQFGPTQADGSRSLILDTDGTPPDPSPGNSACPSAPEQRVYPQTIYLWNGREFAQADHSISSLDNTASPTCKLNWAVVANSDNDQALNLLQGFIGNSDGRHTIETVLGPQGPDYVRFIVATWLDQRGKKDQAKALLQEIQKPETNSTLLDLAKLARTYQDVRSQQGPLSACISVNNVLNKAAEKQWFIGKYDNTLESSQGWNVLNDLIGVVPRAWYQKWSYNICNAVGMLKSDLASADPQTVTEMSNWMLQHGLQWKNVTRGDLDGDGKPDWLVLIPAIRDIHNPADMVEIWGFLQRGSGLKQVYVGDYSTWPTGNSNVYLNWKTLRPGDSSQFQNLVLVNSSLFIFGIEDTGDEPIVRNLFYPNWPGPSWESMDVVSSYSLQPGDDASIQVLRDPVACYGGCALHETYRWDARRESWLLASSDPQPFSDRLRAIETQIFGQQDFPGTIASIQSWLKEGVSNPASLNYPPPKSKDSVSTYLRYLLGLAYEQSGQPELAVQIYYELWKENRNVFGYLASQRLQPK
jgi:hypothetical protein